MSTTRAVEAASLSKYFGAVHRSTLGVVLVVSVSSADAQPSKPQPTAHPADVSFTESMSAEAISRAQGDCCVQWLNLREVSDPRYSGLSDSTLREGRRLRRGIVLTPYQRVALYADSVRGDGDVEVIQRLARPELWVVLFPYSRERSRALVGEETSWNVDAQIALDNARVPADARVFWPQSVELRTTDKPRRTLQPLWTETVDLPFPADLYGEWIRRRSLVAAYALDDPAFVDREVTIEVRGLEEQHGRTTPGQSTFRLATFRARDWSRALQGKVR